jgi:phosphopantothenoylcysteine decarboxylase/phosphopantothenate--cysteine ligase
MISAAAPPEAWADPLAGRRILVGVSGSIAAVKVPLVVSALAQRGAEVRCLLTPSAEALVSAAALASLSRSRCYQAPWPLHVDLAEWADLVLVAPLSATSLGRWVHGLADTLLAAVLMATEAPVLAAAAMNTAMWRSPAVRRNWQALHGWERVLPLGPAPGLLACDRLGEGRMAEPAQLLLALETLQLWGWKRDWQGRRLLVSAGPTREPLDPARCLTNRSSGLMGVLLAQAARHRGARVDLVHGPLRLDPQLLEGLACQPIETAAELQAALRERQPEADAVAMAAAVADHRLSCPADLKLEKHELTAALAQGWQTVPDLLADLVAHRPAGQRLLGFAAQSADGLGRARSKWRRKGCDLLFANPIDEPLAGFAVSTNRGWLFGPGDQERELAPAGKLAIGHQLITALGASLEGGSGDSNSGSQGSVAAAGSGGARWGS